MSVFNLLKRLRALKARKAAKANADAAWARARDRYRIARQSEDTQAQHHAAASLLSAQTERLKLEMGR